MITVDINIPRKEYPIYITSDYEELGKCIKKHCGDVKLFVVTDTNVNKHQADSCIGNLKSLNFDVCKYVFEAGEKQKNLKTIEDIYSFLLDNNADRDSVIVALGGGVVGDVAGFAAATYLRGIDFVQVPTTVLSQADSSVGGKVGVDFKSAKNIVGAFYQPKMVYINVKSIETLHVREIKAGLAEVVKHGIIRDADFFEYIEKNIEKVFEFDEDVLQYIAKQDCIIKGKVVEADEKEQGLRAILNFGHTYGHAIESAYDFKMLHGECVSLGMVAALKMALILEMVEQCDAIIIVETLKKAGLPTIIDDIDTEKVYTHMLHDKKMKDGKFNFILPKKIGEVVKYNTEDEKLIKDILNTLKEAF